MKQNDHISDEQWAQWARSLYDKGQGLQDTASSTSGELGDVAKKIDLYFELKKYPTHQAWEKIQGHIHPKQEQRPSVMRRLIAQPMMRIAASVMIAVLLSVAGYEILKHRDESGSIIEISASMATTSTHTLPDGTVVSLNSNTHLQYPNRFDGNTREVTIEGEAFFEVTPDPTKPFIIHAGKAQVKVLGTSFNVRAYPDADQMEVIVQTGRVQVLKPKTETKVNNELILTPGQKGTLMYQSNALHKSINDNPNFIAWKTHDLVFRSTSLNEVIMNLENVYKVSIRLEDPELGRLLLTAHFNNYPLDFILKVIETTFKLETQQADGQYILKVKS